jgi:hypothetical protein
MGDLINKINVFRRTGTKHIKIQKHDTFSQNPGHQSLIKHENSKFMYNSSLSLSH